MVIIYVGILTGKQEKYDGTYIKATLINCRSQNLRFVKYGERENFMTKLKQFKQ